MKITDILDRLPFELAARLQSDPFFVDIPIVVAVKGNVAQEYQRKQAVIAEKSGKRGVCVIVLQITADDIYEGIPGSPMKLKPSFQVIENVELNNDDSGTKKSARKIARHIVKNMKIAGFRGIIQAMKCAKPCIVPTDVEGLSDACVGEQVNFECQEFSDEQFLYCLPPVCAKVAGQNQIALATATPGAAIWYTTDDTFPFPGDAMAYPDANGVGAPSTAQLYSAPIPVQLNTPILIRAAAYQDGYISSSIERFTITVTSTQP